MTEKWKPTLSRRDIYRVAAELAIGRIPAKDEHVKIELRMNEQFYGSGQTDLSFYSDLDYMYLLLNSWVVASQFDVEKCVRLGLLRNPQVVLDFHGGIGMSAAYLAAALPNAEVWTYTAVPSHAAIAMKLFEKFGLTNAFVTDKLIEADFLLAQETLEHFKNPFEEMRTLLKEVKPKQYLDGSSFTFDNPGHFDPYEDGDIVIDRKKAKRHLNKLLTQWGYVRYYDDPLTGVGKQFNGRPALWSYPLTELQDERDTAIMVAHRPL